MPPAQPPYAIPAKRLDCHVPSHHRFLGPFVERLRSPTTSSRPTVNVPFSPYGYSPPRSPYSLGTLPLRAIRPFAPDTHRRSTEESALLTSPFRCNFNASLNRKQGHSRSGLAHRMSGGGQSRCPALTNGYSGISTSFQPSR